MNDKRNQMQETWPNGRTGRPLQTRWGEKPYYSLDYYLKETFGQKVYKLALDGGMTGPSRSVLGIKPENSINLFMGGLPRRYEEAEGNCKLNACLFTIDTEKKRCTGVRRADIQE